MHKTRKNGLASAPQLNVVTTDIARHSLYVQQHRTRADDLLVCDHAFGEIAAAASQLSVNVSLVTAQYARQIAPCQRVADLPIAC